MDTSGNPVIVTTIPESVPTVIDARKRLQDARDRLTLLEAAETAWATHQQAEDTGKAARKTARDYGEFGKALKEAESAVSRALVPNFIERVNKAAPEGVVFGVTPDFRIGIVRTAPGCMAPVVDTNLSGTERTQAIGAIVAATAPVGKASILTLSSEDVDIDESALFDTMEAWARRMPPDVQVVMTSTKRPKKRGRRGVPKEWTILDLFPTGDEKGEETGASQ